MTQDASDWEMLNAYADEELSTDDRLLIEQRLKDDALFTEMLNDIIYVKKNVNRLHSPGVQNNVIDLVRKKASFKKWAIAASVSLLLLGGSLALIDSREDNFAEMATDFHITLSQIKYNPEAKIIQARAWKNSNLGLIPPDLTGARLFLVQVDQGDRNPANSTIMHYRGLQGCSLSIVAQKDMEGSDLKTQFTSSEFMHYEWQDKKHQFVILTKGMDKKRFLAISEYSHDLFKKQLKNSTDYLMAFAYKATRPCA